LASHITRLLLAQGYKVQGTVRSLSDTSKHQFLLDLPNAKENLKLFEADLLKEGSFDEVVKGCDIFLHTASPFFFGEKDPQKELVDPAVNGTLNLLKSAAKASTIRRVVITSSAASIYDPLDVKAGKVFTEADWNNTSSLTHNAYWFSKVAAERAAWDFVKNEKRQFDLVTLLPPMILGPVLSQVSSEKDLNTSNALLLNTLKSVRNGEPIGVDGYGFVDVNDIAQAHIVTGTALDNPKVSNQRFIVSEGSYSFPDIARKAIAQFPDDFKGIDANNLKVKEDEKAARDTKVVVVSTKHLHDALPDFKITPFDTTLKNTIDNLRDLKFW
jgi:dihydroflavonol-4-reductase